MSRYGGKQAGRPLPIGLQISAMAATFPQFAYDPSARTWTGTLSPTPESPAYRVEVFFDPARDPVTRVLNPTLHAGAPHRFHRGSWRKKGSLCLYLFDDPESGHWDQRSLIAETIVPWAAMWLYFYENWLESGRWFGLEAPHAPKALPVRHFRRHG